MAIGILDGDGQDRQDRNLIRQLQGTERQKQTALRLLRSNLMRSQKNLAELRSKLTQMTIPDLSARGETVIRAVHTAQKIMDQLTGLDPSDPAILVLNRTISILTKEYNFIARRLRGSLQDYNTVNRNIAQLSNTVNQIQSPNISRSTARSGLDGNGAAISGRVDSVSAAGAGGATNNSRVRTNRVGNYVVDGGAQTTANQAGSFQATAQQRNQQNNQAQFWTAFRQDANRNADTANKLLKDILYKLDKLQGNGGGGGGGFDLPDLDRGNKKKGRPPRRSGIRGRLGGLGQSLITGGVIGLGLDAINELQEDKDSRRDAAKADVKRLLDFFNSPSPAAAPAKPGAAGANRDLFKGLPAPIINPNRSSSNSSGGATSGSNVDVAIGTGADVGVRNSEVNLDKDTTKNFFEKLFGYLTDNKDKIVVGAGCGCGAHGAGDFGGFGTGGSFTGNSYGGGVGGGTNPSISRGATRGRGATFIPGVKPGLGQTQSQAQADAQFAREQAQMPAYNTGISGNAAGGATMQMPGGLGGTVPKSVTDLPFGSLGADASSSALKNKNGTTVSTADTGMPAYQRALLDTISGYESNGKGQGYNTIVGGGSFDDYSKHPGIVGVTTAAGPSTAAGRYQFTKSTWNGTPGHPGIVAQFNKEHPDDPITDFSPRNQDRAAYYLAQKDYQRRTGRDLDTDLKNGDYSRIQSGLGGQGNDTTWQGFQGKQGVADAYSRNLEKNKQYADNSALSKIDPSAIPNSGVGAGARASMDDILPGATAGAPGSGMFATVPPLGTEGSSAGAIGKGIIKSNGQSASQASIDGLQPDVRARMYALGLTYSDANGAPLPINSANRTREDQERLYADRANNPNPVARPGHSKHEGGGAFDIPANIAEQLERDGTLDKMGLYRPYKNDPVHIEVKPDAAPLDPAIQARVDSLSQSGDSKAVSDSTPEQKYGPGSGNPFAKKTVSANQADNTSLTRSGSDTGNRFAANTEGFTGQALGTRGFSNVNPVGAFKLPDGTTIPANITAPTSYVADQKKKDASYVDDMLGFGSSTPPPSAEEQERSRRHFEELDAQRDKVESAREKYMQEGQPKPGEKYADWIKRRSDMGLDIGASQGEGDADKSAKFAFGKYNFEEERKEMDQSYKNSMTPGTFENDYAKRLDEGYTGSEEQREGRQKYGNRGPDEFAPREKLTLGEIKALYGKDASQSGISANVTPNYGEAPGKERNLDGTWGANHATSPGLAKTQAQVDSENDREDMYGLNGPPTTVTPKADTSGADRIPYSPPAASTGNFKDDKSDDNSSKPDTSVSGSGSAGKDTSKGTGDSASNVSTSSIPMSHSDLGLVAINNQYLTA